MAYATQWQAEKFTPWLKVPHPRASNAQVRLLQFRRKMGFRTSQRRENHRAVA